MKLQNSMDDSAMEKRVSITSSDAEIAACYPVMSELRPHLDSGMQRQDAHRFYEREGLSKAGFHFAETLSFKP
jgi:hypothetical protein